MEVYVTSEECIKPSLPTPEHLRTHNLSLLEQYAPPVYIPIVLYYHNDQAAGWSTMADDKRSQLLKKSLSKTLTHFYPLAGRIKDHLSIDCNDQGAYYVEACTDSHLIHFIRKPNLSLVSKFLPSPKSWDGPTQGAPVAMIQATFLACGGLVIGASVSQMVLDGASLSVFLKAWGGMARDIFHHHHQAEACTSDQQTKESNSDPIIVFEAASVFPPKFAYSRQANFTSLLRPFFKMGKSTRRFLFEAPAIARLKRIAATSSIVSTSSRVDEQNPTRVEVVSALIWKCAAASFQVKYGLVGRPCLITHAVDMRQRAVPQFPQSFMGNLFWLARAILTADDHKKHMDGNQFSTSINSLVCQLRKASQKIDEEFVRNLQGTEGFEHLVKVVKDDARAFSAVASCGDGIGFTSWCRFDFYHINFGWGNPTWISSVGSPDFESLFTNIVLLLETRWDGIEAWVTLDAKVMAIFEQDPQLLAFASVDPSPLPFQCSCI